MMTHKNLLTCDEQGSVDIGAKPSSECDLRPLSPWSRLRTQDRLCLRTTAWMAGMDCDSSMESTLRTALPSW